MSIDSKQLVVIEIKKIGFSINYNYFGEQMPERVDKTFLTCLFRILTLNASIL